MDSNNTLYRQTTLLEGQPFYNEQKNYLTIGGKGGTPLNSLPITVRDVIGYVADSDNIDASTAQQYYLKYDRGDASLNLKSPNSIKLIASLNDNESSSLTLSDKSLDLFANNASFDVVPNKDKKNITIISTSDTNGFDFIAKNEKASLTAKKLTATEDILIGDSNKNSFIRFTSSDNLTSADFKGSSLTISNGINEYSTDSEKNAQWVSVSRDSQNALSLNFGKKSSASSDAYGTVITYNNITTPKIAGALNEEDPEYPYAELEIDAREVYLYHSQFNVGDKDSPQKIQLDSYLGCVYCRMLNITSSNTEEWEPTLFSVMQSDTFDKTHLNAEVSIRGDLTVKDGKSDEAPNKGNITAEGTITAGKNITASGTVEAQSFNATSDKRLKENIVKYSPNKSILDLPIYSYNFISDEKKTKKIGCLAQDLKEICPEIVKEDDKGYLSIEESKIVYLLLDEIKKLKKRVDELEAR